MRKYIIKETKEVEKVICNKCGKEVISNSGCSTQDVLNVDKRWGYFSDKDNEIHSFDLCESCYDELIQSFKIPVEIE